jgi:hypothetical protein
VDAFGLLDEDMVIEKVELKNTLKNVYFFASSLKWV